MRPNDHWERNPDRVSAATGGLVGCHDTFVDVSGGLCNVDTARASAEECRVGDTAADVARALSQIEGRKIPGWRHRRPDPSVSHCLDIPRKKESCN